MTLFSSFPTRRIDKSGGSLSLLESHCNVRWRVSWAGKKSGLKRSLSFTGEWFPPGRSHAHCHHTTACPAVDVDQYPNGEQASESPVSSGQWRNGREEIFFLRLFQRRFILFRHWLDSKTLLRFREKCQSVRKWKEDNDIDKLRTLRSRNKPLRG